MITVEIMTTAEIMGIKVTKKEKAAERTNTKYLFHLNKKRAPK
jgi:hypothetical protein